MIGGAPGKVWATRALLLLCAGLCYAVYLGMTAEPTRDAALPPSVESVGGPEEEPAVWEPPLLEDLAETVDRPLFNKDRRPVAVDAATTAEAREEVADLSVKGVVIVGSARSALLQIRRSQRMVRALEGDRVGGWEVEAITPEGVRVRRAGRVSDLLLKDLTGQRPRVRGSAAPEVPRAEPREPAAEERQTGTNPVDGEREDK